MQPRTNTGEKEVESDRNMVEVKPKRPFSNYGTHDSNEIRLTIVN